MRGTRRPLGSGGPALSAVAGRLTVILGAVLYGCAFFVPAVGAAATVTVEIIKPDRNPYAFDVGREYEFEAVAFVDGEELPGGKFSWDWDFGDNTAHSTDNPALHTYTVRGPYTVTVTATYAGLSGQDTLTAHAVAAGVGDLFMGSRLIARASLGHNFVGPVCDQVEIAVRTPVLAPPQWTPPFTARFFHDGWPVPPGDPVSSTGEQEGSTACLVAVAPC